MQRYPLILVNGYPQELPDNDRIAHSANVHRSPTEPLAPVEGDLWLNTTNSTLLVFDGLAFTNVFASGDAVSAGDGIDVTANTVSVDLKPNGGLVIESTELALDLGASTITGTLGSVNGGTGYSSYSDGQLLIGKTDGTLAKATITQGAGVTITNGDGDITISATGGTVTNVTGTAPISVANGTTTPAISIASASTSAAGAVQLNDSTSSTSTTTAATPNSVKSAYDLANAALPKAGGTLTGDVTLNAQSDLRFADSNSSNWVAFQGAAAIASNVIWTLPATDGTSGQLLSTNGSGALSWQTRPTVGLVIALS